MGISWSWWSHALVSSLASDGSILYAGGYFTALGDVAQTPMRYISRWDGNSWSEMGSATDTTGPVTSLIWNYFTSSVFVTGGFNRIGGTDASRIAVWNVNDESWSSLGNGLDGYGNAVASSDGQENSQWLEQPQQ